MKFARELEISPPVGFVRDLHDHVIGHGKYPKRGLRWEFARDIQAVEGVELD
jgi:hypothetical protein